MYRNRSKKNQLTLLSQHFMSEYCSYGELHDKMIRDQMVVDIKDPKISEKLQLEKN